MQEITKVTLENEMDLILAHRRSMKLAELAGMSLPSQTSFATAVSEVSRNAIENARKASIQLGIESNRNGNYITACLKQQVNGRNAASEGLEYARKLVSRYNVQFQGNETSIELFCNIPAPFVSSAMKIDEWRSLFRNEPPVTPYDELKRKNEQLQELSQKIQKSEEQYRILTNSLPLIIFALDLKGSVMYGNEWLNKFTGETVESLNTSIWSNVVHPSDHSKFHGMLDTYRGNGGKGVQTQARFRHKDSEDYLWHQVSLTPFRNEQTEIQYWIGYIVDIHAQKVFEETLRDNIELKKAERELKENQLQLESTIADLNRSNLELQQFAYVASHDLQEPVRKLLFYSDYLMNRYRDDFDRKALDYLDNMQTSAQRMRNLIQDLLVFSQINREEIRLVDVDLNRVAADSLQDLEIAIEEKKAVIQIDKLPVVKGDERMLRQLFENIISNALKYSVEGQPPQISIRALEEEGRHLLNFQDNGIGFDEKYLPQMFMLFQRLHPKTAYEGTGLGLAICRKVVEMHDGTISATGKPGEGSCFHVSLPADSAVS